MSRGCWSCRGPNTPDPPWQDWPLHTLDPLAATSNNPQIIPNNSLAGAVQSMRSVRRSGSSRDRRARRGWGRDPETEGRSYRRPGRQVAPRRSPIARHWTQPPVLGPAPRSAGCAGRRWDWCRWVQWDRRRGRWRSSIDRRLVVGAWRGRRRSRCSRMWGRRYTYHSHTDPSLRTETVHINIGLFVLLKEI